MDTLVGFAIGMCVGAAIGIFVGALASIAKKHDWYEEGFSAGAEFKKYNNERGQ